MAEKPEVSPQVQEAINRARDYLGRLPHPDWLITAVGISREEAEEALTLNGWNPPQGYKKVTPVKEPRKPLDLHNLPRAALRWGLMALALIATVREFGYVQEYFQGVGGILMALLISGGSTILPQAVAVLWPNKGAGFKILGGVALLLGLAVLVSSVYITTQGIYRSQESQVDKAGESQARELGEIIQGLERQIESKTRDLSDSRGRSQGLTGWQLGQEQARGDRLARELTELENRLEDRRLELSQTQASITSVARVGDKNVDVTMTVIMAALVSCIGPLALGAALWGKGE